jgi:uncharacterized protein YndB with AHSA1/START domain
VTATLNVRHWIAAPRREVWNAYTTPELFHRFFAPDGLTIPLNSVVMELHVGGRFEFDMVFEQSGEISPNRGILREIDPPNRLVFHEPDFMGNELFSTQSFSDEGAGTLISVTQQGVPPELVGDPAVLEAFRSCFRKLGRVLGVDTEERS